MRLSAKYPLAVTASLLAVVAATAQNQPTPTTAPYPTPLYQMNDVAKSLSLTPDQITRLNQATTNLQTRFGKDYSAIGEKDRAAQTQTWLNNYNTAWTNAARDIFTADQLNRYNQLRLQYHGFNSFTDPAIQDRLKLTDQQRAQIREGIDWSNQQWSTIQNKAGTDQPAATQLYNQYWKDRASRMNTVLTPEQQRTWNQMIGSPYQFQPWFPRR